MNRPFSSIPHHVLAERGTALLRQWLIDRGLTMSLADLDAERRLRNINTPRHNHKGKP